MNIKFLRFYLPIIALFFTTYLYSQKDRPLSTVKASNDRYIDETEVDVSSWLSYYTWVMVHKGPLEANKVLPDSSAIEPELWVYIKQKSTNYIDYPGGYTSQPIGYFDKECKSCAKFGKRLPSEHRYCPMLHFPITGLTYEQVVKFCEWRTQIEGDNKFVFRLPTPDEWKEFAIKGLSEQEVKNGIQDSLTKKNCALFNYKIFCNCSKDTIQGRLNGVGMYEPEKTGSFDVFGNVSEMTSVKGLAKGGNYTLYAKQCHVDSIQHYDKPEKWLGFRCIVIKNKSDKVGNQHSAILKDATPEASNNDKSEQFTDLRDGQTYPIVQIGTQVWMAANLAFKTDSGCWAYDNKQSNVISYGYLYNWEMAKNVCPIGWHLPSKEEFETLLQNFGGSDTKSSYKALIPSGNSGFSVLFAGFSVKSRFSQNGKETAFWSSSEDGKKIAWTLSAASITQIAGIYSFFNKNSGLSVRCIKDK